MTHQKWLIVAGMILAGSMTHAARAQITNGGFETLQSGWATPWVMQIKRDCANQTGLVRYLPMVRYSPTETDARAMMT